MKSGFARGGVVGFVLAGFVYVTGPVCAAANGTVAARATQDANAEDWIAARWPVVAEVEAAVAKGELDAARAKFDAWFTNSGAALFEGLDAERVLQLAARLELVAAALGRGEAKLEVRLHVCEELATLPTPDDPRRVSALERLATAHAELGDLDATLAVFDEVHTLLATHRAADDEKLLRAKSNLAAALHRVGQFERASQVRGEVVAVYAGALPDADPRLVRARRLHATALVEHGRYDEARELRRVVHETLAATLPPGDLQRVEAQREFATSLALCGDWEGALELHEEVLAHFESVAAAHDPARLNSQIDVGMALLQCGEFERSGELLRGALAASEAALPEEHAVAQKARNGLGGWCSIRGELREALALESKVLEILARSPSASRRETLRAESNVALMRWRTGDVEGAYATRRRVLAECELAFEPDDPARLEAQSSLVASLLDIGDLHAALELAESTLASLERAWPDDERSIVAARGNVAAARHCLGDIEGARVLRADIVERLGALYGPDHPDVLRAQATLASALHACGEHAEALVLRRRVHEIRSQTLGEEDPERIEAAFSLAISLAGSGALEEARELYARQLELSNALYAPTHRKHLQLRANLGAVAGRLGDVEYALELHESVVRDVIVFDVVHPMRLQALANLVISQDAAGEHEAQRTTMLELLDATRALASDLAVQPPRLTRAIVAESIARLSDVVVCDRRAAAAGQETVAAELFGALEALRQAATMALDVAHIADEDDVVRELVLDVRWRGKDLAERALVPPTETAQLEAWRADLLERTRQRERAEGALRLALAERGAVRVVPSAAAVGAALAPDELFVSYWRASTTKAVNLDTLSDARSDELVAFVVEPDGTGVLVEFGSVDHLVTLAEAWRVALGRPLERGIGAVAGDADAEVAAARALRSALLDPCLAVVGERKVARVHVVLDDFLHLVPIDALVHEDGALVGDVLEIVVESSTARLLAGPSAQEPRGTLVAFGGIDYGAQLDLTGSEVAAVSRGTSGTPSNFAPLLSSRIEAEYVGALFEESGAGEPTLLLREHADKRTLAALAPQTRWLHVATHGWFAPESSVASILDRIDSADAVSRDAAERAQEDVVGFLPETLCGLAFAGANRGSQGILTAEELATLDLSNCELAVLSACETNVGIRRAGQGIQSLQTALHAAGARTAITSLWKVDDAATRRLYEIFYTKLWSDELGPADALWQAKMALRAEGHPTRDWAGWVLTGDPD